MRVMFVRAWVRRVLCSWLVLLALAALVLVPDPTPPAPRSPFRHIPAEYIMHRTAYPHKYTGSGCITSPGFSQIQYSAAFWQHVTAPSEREHERDVLVFAAYWDGRERDKPLVRLLVFSERELPTLRCLFWYFDRGDPVIMEASAPANPATDQHVVSCAPPSRAIASPAALSLVPAGIVCGMTRNMLAIQGIPPPGGALPTTPGPAGTRRMAVCAVWWRRGDAAVRLAEWLQMLRYLQVGRVYFYINHNAHKNVLRVIDFYSYHAELDGMTLDVMPYVSPPINGSDGKVKTERTTVGINPAQGDDFEEYSDIKYKDDGGSEEDPPPIHQGDLFPYNECIYRALLDGIDWVAPLDLDEIIVPVRHGTWAELASKETSRARYEVDETPDVLDFERWWFPELLQTDLPPPSAQRHTAPPPLTNMPGGGPETSAAPRVVPPGRMFAYQWRAPTARADVALTGKLLRVGSLVGVTRRGARCIGECSLRAVDPEVARVHLYTWGCGGAARGACRALRGAARRDEALWKWRRAQQEAALTLRRVRLSAHASSHADDL